MKTIYLSAEGAWEIFMRKRNQVIAAYLEIKDIEFGQS
jgi:hypothetical protein